MKKNLNETLLKIDLQYFAEEGENESGIAEPVQTDNVTTSEQGESGNDDSTNEPQSAEENAKYAAARREAEEQIKQRDNEYKKRFGSYKNPLTGKSIETEKDYFDALDAQSQLEEMKKSRAAQEQLQKQGINPEILQQALMGTPFMKRAIENEEKVTMSEALKQQEENARWLTEGIKEISKYDSAIKTEKDLDKLTKYKEMIPFINNGLSLQHAYQLVYADEIRESIANQVRQGTLNNVNGKNHLTKTDSIGGSGSDVNVPESTMASMKKMYASELASGKLTISDLRKKAAQFVQ